jgi:hypothetical protein
MYLLRETVKNPKQFQFQYRKTTLKLLLVSILLTVFVYEPSAGYMYNAHAYGNKHNKRDNKAVCLPKIYI